MSGTTFEECDVILEYGIKVGRVLDEGTSLVVVAIDVGNHGRDTYGMTSVQARQIAMALLHSADVLDGKIMPGGAPN